MLLATPRLLGWAGGWLEIASETCLNAIASHGGGAMAFTQKQAEQTDRIGMHRADHGLFLMVRTAGTGSNATSGNEDDAPRTRSWVFAYQLANKRREMGLGPLSAISLKQAKALAAEQRELLRRGVDPIEERKRRKAAEVAKDGDRVIVTFQAVAQAYLESRQERKQPWTEKHAHDWQSSMSRHVYPSLGAKAVRKITSDDVIDVLRPLWGNKHKTALKVRQQMEAVLEYAVANKHCDENQRNPADIIKRISVLHGATKEVYEVEPHAALDYSDVPAFMVRLQEHQHAVSARALAFTILTAVRTGDVLGMRWRDVNFDTRTWTVPKTKTRKDFRVPLSAAAIKILRWQHERQLGDDGYVFPGKPGCGISSNTMRRFLRSLEVASTVHGFRASCRSWAESRTEYPDAVCEMVLAHAIKGIKKPYQRDDLYAKRRALMDDWATFITTPTGDKVVRLHKPAEVA
jgi:integrase